MKCKVFVTGETGECHTARLMQGRLMRAGCSAFVPVRLTKSDRLWQVGVAKDAELDRQWLQSCDAILLFGDGDELSKTDNEFAFECGVPRFDSVKELLTYCGL